MKSTNPHILIINGGSSSIKLHCSWPATRSDPEKTLLAFAEHGKVKDLMPLDDGNAETVLAEFSCAGVNAELLAAELQREGTAAIAKSWKDLISPIAAKSEILKKVTPVCANK